MTTEEIYEKLHEKFCNVFPALELRWKAELVHEIIKLKEEKNAIILGHNYMEPVLYYSIPDFMGDSLQLSRKAAHTDKDMIVFCGVKFMAETAKILNPEKTVLVPSLEAGCSLAENITAEDVKALKEKFPGVPVVTYVNTYADVKAESDVCCTSGNAAAVAESLNSETIIFLPDEYLARNIARETGKHIIFPAELSSEHGESATELDYQFIGWKGRCEVHEMFSVEDIENIRNQYPDAVILTHPECHPDVAAVSDFCGSTSAMIKYVEETSKSCYVLLTECTMGENIATVDSTKEILQVCRARCPHMALITLEATLDALKNNQYVIDVPEDIRLRAVQSVERMLAIG